MNCVRTFSFVRRGQNSAFFSFLRRSRERERDVRFFADSYKWEFVSEVDGDISEGCALLG